MDENLVQTPQTPSSKNYFPIIAVAVVLLIIVGFAASKNLKSTGPGAIVEPSSPPADTNTGGVVESDIVDEVKEFSVKGSNFKFDVTSIKVKNGDKVKIIFTNEEGMHDFALDEFNIKTKILKAGESETVEFVANKTGSFEYYCSVSNHRTMGMKGILIVE